MRTLYILISVLLFTSAAGAQSPQRLSYQAVLKDASQHLITTQVNIHISILQGAPAGTAIFAETRSTTPDLNGLVAIQIGQGIPVTGSIENIDWQAGPYYIKTVTDIGGGNTLESISQLLSVPYAFYAKSSGGHYIGEFFGGGIIVAVSKNAGVEHGLIASLTNMGPAPGTAWDSLYNTMLIGPAAQSLSDGQANTNAMLASDPGFESPAKLCDDYTNPETGTGVFSDWYLPSIRELKECYSANFAVTSLLGIINGFLFDNYWSSTENPNDVAGEKTCYFIGFHIGLLNPGGHKTHLLRVRAVRKF